MYPRYMRRRSREGRYAERVLVGVDDVGEEERILFWIERRPGAVWAVGRAVNSHLRESDEPRPEDVIFEGYELGDALQRANEALEDDVNVLEGVLELVALEDDVLGTWLVRFAQVRVHRPAHCPDRTRAALDPEEDPLLLAHVVHADEHALRIPAFA